MTDTEVKEFINWMKLTQVPTETLVINIKFLEYQNRKVLNQAKALAELLTSSKNTLC